MDEAMATRTEAMLKVTKPSMTSILDETEEHCLFCGEEVEYNTIKGFGRFGPPKRCSCDGAKRVWSEYDRAVDEEEQRIIEERRQHRISVLFEQSMLPLRWKTRTFEHFQVNDKNRKAYEVALGYANNFDGVSGLLLSGPVGTGKTHLSAAIGLRLMARGHSVMFGTVTTLLAKLRNTYDNGKETELDVMNRLMRCELLVIDDMGKEKVSDWVEQTVFEIINTRYEQNRALVVTSNLTLTGLSSKYPQNGDAIMSRLIEMCKGVKVDGPDRRKMVLA